MRQSAGVALPRGRVRKTNLLSGRWK
jgi:hypothetical protein